MKVVLINIFSKWTDTYIVRFYSRTALKALYTTSLIHSLIRAHTHTFFYAFLYLAQQLTCKLEQLEIKLPITKSVGDLVYVRSYSHPSKPHSKHILYLKESVVVPLTCTVSKGQRGATPFGYDLGHSSLYSQSSVIKAFVRSARWWICLSTLM